MTMKVLNARFVFSVAMAACVLSFASCDRNPFSGSKLSLANYNKVTTGMSKAQVEQILGSPTKMEKKDMILFTKTTYRYEEGKNFAMITFKNDEVDSKDTNLSPKS